MPVDAPPADSDGFFAGLPLLGSAADTFDGSRYRAAPDDWELVVTDIVGSTAAVAAGRHKTVNFVAAMAIAALKNLCAPVPIPFLFGGDGSVVMVPAGLAAASRQALARVRGFALREFGIQLRVGQVPVALLRRHGSDVMVGRFEPSPGNSFGVFQGGGIAMLEAAVRGKGLASLAESSIVPESLDDGEPVNLAGLSCRWDALRSGRGRMVSLIIQGASDPGRVHADVMGLARQGGDPRPVRADNLSTSWPPKGFMMEARAARGAGALWKVVLRLAVDTLIARLFFVFMRPMGGFDPRAYLGEVATNTDFCKHDDTVSFVIDCPQEAVEPIRAYLESQRAAGALRYGMHVSETALMTCLVDSPTQNLHVHFVDGGDGGYTSAAKVLKAQLQGVAGA